MLGVIGFRTKEIKRESYRWNFRFGIGHANFIRVWWNNIFFYVNNQKFNCVYMEILYVYVKTVLLVELNSYEI